MARGAAHEAREAMLGGAEDDAGEQEAAELAMREGDEDEDEDGEEQADEDLMLALMAERAASLGHDGDQIADDQVKAFDRYLGKDYGDEIAGSSRVHTREVFETIEAMRPKAKRMFGRGAKTITVEPWAPGEEAAQQAQEAQDYLRGVLFGDPQQLDGHAIFDDFFFDGALQKIGWGAVCWEEAELGPPEKAGGLNLLQAQQLATDAQKPDAPFELRDIQPESGDGQEQTFVAVVQHVRRPAKAVIEIIAPEDILVSRLAVDLTDPPYCGHKMRRTLSRIKAMWPDKADEIDEVAGSDALGVTNDARRQARFWDLDESSVSAQREDEDDIELFREYIRFDRDGDGYPELLECWSIGDLLLEAEPADDNPYFYWTPIRIPHRLIGLSIADVESDIQRTNTVHLRNANNASALAVTPRKVVHPGHINMPDLLNVVPGGIIRMNQQSQKLPAEVIKEETTPDLSGAALKMMEKMDRLTERRTGVTEHLQGMNPDVLNQTMGGIDLLQNASAERVECYLEAMAAGLGPGLTKFLRLHVAHVKSEREVNVSAKANKADYRKFNPSKWSRSLKVAVQTGQGTGNRQVRIGQLMGIMVQQEKVVARFGPANPIVTPKHLHNTVEQIVREMGFLSADEFFADPSTLDDKALAAMMQPPADPKAQEAMAKAQIQMQEMQQDMRQFVMKTQQEMQQFMMKLQAETQAKREQLGAEVALSREETQAKTMASVAGARLKAGPRTEVGGEKV